MGANMKRKAIQGTVFAALLLTVLFYVDKVMMFKYGDGIYPLTQFYELEEDTVDVLVLGSSRAFENVNPGILWEEYQIAAYDLCGSVQPLWNTYYYLKEALKSQHPQLIILEAYRVCENRDYMDDSKIIKNNFGLNFSADKLKSLGESVPVERYGEFLLEFCQYHSRYTDLSRADFTANLGRKNFDCYKGFGCNYTTKAYEKPDVSNVTDQKALTGKTEEYYRKIIEIAGQEEIPLLIVVAPYPIEAEDQRYYNRAEAIAREYGIPFINYNLMYDSLQLDFQNDIADDLHLNYRGSEKFTRHLGEYISTNYELKPHSGESLSWEINARDTRERIDNYKLTLVEDREEYINKILGNENFTIILSVDGVSKGAYDEIVEVLRRFGIYRDGYDLTGTWVCQNGKILFYGFDKEDYKYHQELGSMDLTVRKTEAEGEDGKRSVVKEICIDEKSYYKVEDGVNIMVYDHFTDTYVDAVGFGVDNFSTAKR